MIRHLRRVFLPSTTSIEDLPALFGLSQAQVWQHLPCSEPPLRALRGRRACCPPPPSALLPRESSLPSQERLEICVSVPLSCRSSFQPHKARRLRTVSLDVHPPRSSLMQAACRGRAFLRLGDSFSEHLFQVRTYRPRVCAPLANAPSPSQRRVTGPSFRRSFWRFARSRERSLGLMPGAPRCAVSDLLQPYLWPCETR